MSNLLTWWYWKVGDDLHVAVIPPCTIAEMMASYPGKKIERAKP